VRASDWLTGWISLPDNYVGINVAVNKPAIAGSPYGAPNTHQTVLRRSGHYATNRRRVGLSQHEGVNQQNVSLNAAVLTPGPLFEWRFVLTHTISSHLLNPHFANTSLPLSSPSEFPCPTQRKMKLGSAERDGMGREDIWSQSIPPPYDISCGDVAPSSPPMRGGICDVSDAAAYGGSIRMTSNLVGWRDGSEDRGRCVGGCACAFTAACFRASSLCCFGYLCKVDEKQCQS
jgi:hypothetical protein